MKTIMGYKKWSLLVQISEFPFLTIILYPFASIDAATSSITFAFVG